MRALCLLSAGSSRQSPSSRAPQRSHSKPPPTAREEVTVWGHGAKWTQDWRAGWGGRKVIETVRWDTLGHSPELQNKLAGKLVWEGWEIGFFTPEHLAWHLGLQWLSEWSTLSLRNLLCVTFYSINIISFWNKEVLKTKRRLLQDYYFVTILIYWEQLHWLMLHLLFWLFMSPG